MLRSTMSNIEGFMKTTRLTLAHFTRGKIQIDFADTNIQFANGMRAGNILGIEVIQKDALNNGEINYEDHAGNAIADNGL